MGVDASVRPVGVPGDLGWMVQANAEQYAAEFGWDASYEALVARIVADFAATEGGAGWIAEQGGRRLGCVLSVPAPDDPDTAVLRILLVQPEGRGRGLGGRLVDEVLDQARVTGRKRVRLWTNDCLTAARRIYLDRGFALVDEAPHRSFGADLVGQTYLKEL